MVDRENSRVVQEKNKTRKIHKYEQNTGKL